jgi:hypothetical protein
MDTIIGNEVLTGDVFYHGIAKNMSMKDLYSLSRTCNYYYNNIINVYIKNKVLTEIDRRLKNVFGFHLDKFKQILHNINGVITGSFILQCILNVEWNDTDIDIFVPVDGDYMNKKDNNNERNILYYFMTDTLLYQGDTHACNYGNELNKIQCISTYGKDGMPYRIQITFVDVERNINTLCDYMNDNFDFEICKNVYYNNDIHFYRINDILSKKTNFQVSNRLGSSISRAKKYIKRGFEFSSEDGKINIYDNCGSKITFEDLANRSYDAFVKGNTKSIFHMKKTEKICHTTKYKHMGDIIEGNIYKLISGDPELIIKNSDSGRKLKLINNDELEIYSIKHDGSMNECYNSCLVKFCDNSIRHIHYEGKHICHGSYTDFIFIIDE